jgi:enterobacterial common antigen flippase
MMQAPTLALEQATPARTEPAQAAARSTKEHSYSQIFKSTTLIGGSQAISIAFGIVRTKAMALLLGPAGVGLLGLYNSVNDVAFSLAGLGIQSSGVRQIADAVGSGQTDRIAVTATVLRRVSVVLGAIGGLLLVLMAKPISTLTFGSNQHVVGVSLLSLALLCRLVSGCQGALLQGLRRISDLAMMTLLGAIASTVISIPLVYVFGERGVVPSIVAVGVATFACSWWYSRKVKITPPRITVSEVTREASDLFKLGLAFMASSFFTMGAAYAVRIIIVHHAGLSAAGLYQAAWTLGGLYVGFILQAMGSDFYPRLTGVSRDNAECNRLVNEQAQVSLLMAGPGVMATLTFAPLVITTFYSARFGDAVPILRWVCLGMMLRVVAWPMGYIVLAKGAQLVFFWTELAATVVHVGLAWLLVPRIGTTGAGAAFCGLYVWHSVLIYAIVRRLSGFRWSVTNTKLLLQFLSVTLLVFVSPYMLPRGVAIMLGAAAVAASGIYSARILLGLLRPEAIPAAIRSRLPKRWMARFRRAALTID